MSKVKKCQRCGRKRECRNVWNERLGHEQWLCRDCRQPLLPIFANTLGPTSKAGGTKAS